MRSRLEEYVYGDPAARQFGDRLSLVAALLWYVVGASFKAPGIVLQSVLILVVCQVGTTLLSCLRPSGEPGLPTVGTRPVASNEPLRRMGLRAAIGFLAALAVAVLSAPTIEAALIDERLRRISRSPTLRSLRTAAALVSSANSEGLLLSKRPIEKLLAQRLTLEDVRVAVTQAVNQEASARGVPGPLIGIIVQKPVPVGQIVITGMSGQSLETLSHGVDKTTGSLVPPDMVAFVGPLEGQLPLPTSRGAAYIRINGTQGLILVPLDGLQCRNIIFSECTVTYFGAPIKLENTGFANCTFVLAENLKCQQFAERVLASPAVTFSVS